MRPRSLLPCLLIPLLLPAATAQLPLAEVVRIARDRAERSRPTQEKALEPFWADLSLDYRNNAQFLDARIAEVATLGDSVVPLLLERLQPTQGGDVARHLAANCRRVLERLDPSSFLDALAELASGNNDVGRGEAIRLLGLVPLPQSTALLADLLDRVTGDDRRQVVRSLRLQRAASAAGKVVTMLGSNDRVVREDVLAYLIAARPPQVADTVLQAMAVERDPKLLPSYVEYFAVAVREHDAAARALLPLADPERLDWQDRKRLVQALATVAPREHEPTLRKLHELLDSGETSALGVEAAVTLKALGDRQGVTKLKRLLDEQLRKPQRKREAGLYQQRANLNFAIEEYGDAFADYESMREFSDGMTMTRLAFVGLMRCEARRKKVPNLLKLMKASGMLVAEIEAIGYEDPVFHETLQQERVRSFLTGLAKEQAPK